MIINEFKNIAGYNNQKLEMLNSSTVVDFIQGHLVLRQDSSINKILKNIEREAERIDKGNL